MDRVEPQQKDALSTVSIGYTLPTQTVAAFSVGQETESPR
jgi:hypothetical protein